MPVPAAASSDTVVKLLRAAEWEAFRASGGFAGSPDDLRDGFIHLSTPEQVAGTAERHFAGEDGLVAVTLRLAGDPALRWEVSHGGQPFPHLYRPLALVDVAEARRYSAGLESAEAGSAS
jgi:uncharacterized protein (DUF952 family)